MAVGVYKHKRGWKHKQRTKEKIGKANKGKKRTEETKEKQRQRKLKNPVRYWLGKKRPEALNWLTPFEKGLIPWNKGIRGKDSHSWKGGGVHLYKHYQNADYIEWRKKVFERDNYSCLNCGARGRKNQQVVLHPHHIKSYTNFPNIRYDVNNGVTLCVSCHHKVHWGH